ncbi:MAG TPA: hypothetical protein DCG75_05520 [Bacteroidales bacterium]|nr:hypothetical protein [Bacteroidales bacterium]
MQVKQFEIWIADLNPQIGTEPGKTSPVLVVQTNLLNKIQHPSADKIYPSKVVQRVIMKQCGKPVQNLTANY